MFHKKGNIFHRTRQGAISQAEYREAIKSALSYELSGVSCAAKTTAKWTGASERTVKNWISGSYSPSGEHLIELMRHSDAALEVVLELAGRSEALTAERIKRVRRELATVLNKLDAIYGSQE